MNIDPGEYFERFERRRISLERCNHRHPTIRAARACDRKDLDDIGCLSDGFAYIQYVQPSEQDDAR